MLGRRHEPGADRRRDARHVAQGALPRYVGVPPAARARAAPARAPHRAPEPARAPAREPAPRLPAPPPRLPPAHAAHLCGRPLATTDPGLPTAPNVANDSNVANVAAADDAANQTVLRARVSADRGDACKEAVCHASADDACFIVTGLFLRDVGSDLFVCEHEPYALDIQHVADCFAYSLAGRVRLGPIGCLARIDDVTLPYAVYVPYLPVLPGRLS